MKNDIFTQFCENLKDFINWHNGEKILGYHNSCKFYGLNPDFRVSYEIDENRGDKGKIIDYKELMGLLNLSTDIIESSMAFNPCFNNRFYNFYLWYKDLNIKTLSGCSLDNGHIYVVFPIHYNQGIFEYKSTLGKDGLEYYLSGMINGTGSLVIDRSGTELNSVPILS